MYANALEVINIHVYISIITLPKKNAMDVHNFMFKYHKLPDITDFAHLYQFKPHRSKSYVNNEIIVRQYRGEREGKESGVER